MGAEPTSSSPGIAASVARGPFVAQIDILMLGYLAACMAAVAFSPAARATRVTLVWELGGAASLIVGAMWISRRATSPGRLLRANSYRSAYFLVVLGNYMMLRALLPAVRPDTVDGTLLHIDRLLFGESPAIWLQRFNQQPINEWFSFFYFSYFAICGLYVIGVLWFEKNPDETNRFAMGSLIVMNLGQLGYMLVPATGPGRADVAEFAEPLHGGLWWHLVSDAVQAGSAMKDVFPSLHTAVPLWFALYAATHSSKSRRWRIIASVTGFFSANIIISTMLLRWHYAIDVVAGIALATGGVLGSRWLAARERQRWNVDGHSGAWQFGGPAS